MGEYEEVKDKEQVIFKENVLEALTCRTDMAAARPGSRGGRKCVYNLGR